MESLSYQIPAKEPFDSLDQDHALTATHSGLPLSVSDEQRAVVAFLTEPRSYGETDPVDRIDMMSSVLFMAGGHCYKLQRDVPLGQSEAFTLEQRHQLAKEEMRLGSAFAPELYLGLVPVRCLHNQLFLDLPLTASEERSTDVARMASEAPIVDWLIMMQRYDFSKCYDKRVEIYQPNFDECNRLADLIAPSQTRRQKRRSARSWLRHLEEMIGSFSPLVRALDRDAKNTTLRACLNRASELLERASQGLQERCQHGQFHPIHGNLGLSNVVETSKGLRLIHPLVSSKANQVRKWHGDPFYDLASLIAELWSRGLHRQANWVFSHYCNNQVDSDALNGLKVLDLYIFMRATDRAKRLSAALTTRPLHETDGGMKPRALKGYVTTARESLLQDEAALVVIGGSTHANRSNLARLLAPVIGRLPGAVYLSADQEILSLHAVASPSMLPQSAHRKSVWRLVYRRMAEKALIALETGYSVVLEGRFDSPESREILTELDHKIPTSVLLQAFHLFDTSRDHRHGAELAPKAGALEELELQSASSGCDRVELGTSEAVLPILRRTELSRDWTRWIELDASSSVGSLLEQTLSQINPEWTPVSKGTLH
ncbi:hypothetical protein [Cohaesibacter sp. ES.047]|uniref:AAA family ATPase n=1 Tax=Cohaesibacter sp. ES.047 TaxID=1798205 RepID=UPI0012FDEF33|nr:hypothetical protein [Cohaesibacter sp. ES.047]